MNDKKKHPFFLDKWWLAGWMFTAGLAWFTQPAMSAFSVLLFVVIDLFAWPIYVGAVVGRLIAQVLR
jgi:hypothetical protein